MSEVLKFCIARVEYGVTRDVFSKFIQNSESYS